MKKDDYHKKIKSVDAKLHGQPHNLMFSYYETGIKQTKPSGTLSFEQLINQIRNSPYKQKIDDLHKSVYKSKEYNDLKCSLPYVTPAGIFGDRRNNHSINELSGYMYFDIDSEDLLMPIETERQKFLGRLADTVSLLSISVGGRGLSFYVKVDGLTVDNFSQAYEYLRQDVFKDIPIDNNAKGLSRPHIIPSDPNVFVNHKNQITISENHLQKYSKSIIQYKKNKEKSYTLNDTFFDIGDVLKRMIWKTKVEISNGDYEIKPVEMVKVFVPKKIKDGEKHKVFRTLTNHIVFLNPDFDLKTVLSFINWVNAYYTDKPMMRKELVNTVSHIFNHIMNTGEIIIHSKIQYIHFDANSKRSGTEKRAIAAQLNGAIRKSKSLDKIEKARIQLLASKVKVTQKAVSELTALSITTVKRLWKETID